MHAVRVLPPLFLLPSWTGLQLRQLHRKSFGAGVVAAHNKAQAQAPSKPRTGSKAHSKSLLEELFPETSPSVSAQGSEETDVPRLALDVEGKDVEKQHPTRQDLDTVSQGKTRDGE